MFHTSYSKNYKLKPAQKVISIMLHVTIFLDKWYYAEHNVTRHSANMMMLSSWFYDNQIRFILYYVYIRCIARLG